MKAIKTKLNEDNTVVLSKDLVKELQLKPGDQIILNYEQKRQVDECFFVEEDIEGKFEKEEYYCIPMRMIKRAGLEGEDMQLIMGVSELTLISTEKVLTSLPAEVLEAMVEEDIDLISIADRIVEGINRHVLEIEEE